MRAIIVNDARHIPVVAAMVAVLVCTACSGSPGRPKSNSEIIAPNQVIDFNLLYGQNCAGCHGASEGVEQRSRWPTRISCDRDDNVIRAPRNRPYRALRCPPLRRVRVECSPTSRSTR